MRIGHGYDVHKLVEGRPLILGGVTIPFEKGLLGHSDADVLLHAISDALLGAAALGDIGHLFPDTDDRWKGADSLKLLEEVVRVLADRGYHIENIDATLLAQRPKLAPYIDEMRGNIADACQQMWLPPFIWRKIRSILRPPRRRDWALPAPARVWQPTLWR